MADDDQQQQASPPNTPPTGDKSTLKVDVFGLPLDLPLDIAKVIIKRRDERSELFQNLDTKVKAHETELADTKRRLSAAEAAKAGNLAEAEAIFGQKLETQVGKYRSRLVKNEIIATLVADPTFLDTPKTRDDAVKLILADNEFALGDDDAVKTKDGKSVTDVVKGFITERDAFKRVSNGHPPRQGTPAAIPAAKAKVSLADGLKSVMGI